MCGMYDLCGLAGAKSLDSGVCEGLGKTTLDPAQSGGIRYTALLRVPADGLYRFSVSARRGNGCEVTVDEQCVLNARSIYFTASNSQWVGLAGGLHRFEMTSYRYTHRAEAQVFWEGPGLPRTPLAEAEFFLDPDETDKKQQPTDPKDLRSEHRQELESAQ
jgi:hypothetical protein